MHKFSKVLLKVGDLVYVTTGSDKKKTGKIIDFDRKRGKIKVEGINMKVHYLKRSEHGKSGMAKMEGWLDLSNVNFCENDGPVRLSKNSDGKRISKKSKELV